MRDFLVAHWPRYLWRARPLDPAVDFHAAVGSHPRWQLAAFDGDTLAATFHGVPVSWPDGHLPDDGWDRALREHDPDGDTLIGLAITISHAHRGQGLSGWMLDAVRHRAGAFRRLLIPVRPNHKSLQPTLRITDYVAQRRPDGLCTDPWLRTHQRAGGEILGVCERSMQLVGTPDEWARWLEHPVPDDGIVEGMLYPLSDDGVYREPNVWVRHSIPRA
jgi:GNAT superfamily N-acetyltransferase